MLFARESLGSKNRALPSAMRSGVGGLSLGCGTEVGRLKVPLAVSRWYSGCAGAACSAAEAQVSARRTGRAMASEKSLATDGMEQGFMGNFREGGG